MIVGCQSQISPASTQTGTSIYDDPFSGAVINGQAEYDNGAATVTVGSSNAHDNHTISAVDVGAAAGGGGGSTFTPIVMVV
jgi:hypothetical protein